MKGLRLYTSPRSVLLCLLPLAAITYLFSAMPFSGLYLGTLVLFVFPFALQTILTVAGPLPALAGVMIAAAGLHLAGGPQAALAGSAYLLPSLAVYYVCIRMKWPWQRSMLALGASYVLAVLGLFLLGRGAFGADPFSALSQSAAASIDSMPDRDYFLNTMYRFGLLTLPADIAQSPLVPAPAGGYAYSPAALNDFYKQISLRVDVWLRALLPTLTCSYSIWLATAGPFVSTHYGKKHAQRLAFRGLEGSRPDDSAAGLILPEFSKWHIPKQQGLLLWACAGLSLLARISAGGDFALAGQMLYQVAAAFFTIQGLSMVNFIQKRQNVRPAMRGLSLMALMMFISQAAMLIGVYEQIADPRKLRKPPKTDDLTDRRMDT